MAILHVMKRLGYKRIENTLLYTQLLQLESDEYHSAIVQNFDEARELKEAAIEYLCTHKDLKLFRKTQVAIFASSPIPNVSKV